MIIAFTYTCGACGHEFEAPEAPEQSYGLFVIRNEQSDAHALIEAPTNDEFVEVCSLVKQIDGISELPSRKLACLKQAVFSKLYSEF